MASRRYGACVLYQRAAVLRMMCRGMSAAADLHSQVDFLKGEPHRNHPGVTNLKTLRLPEELQMAARCIIQRAEVPRLADRAHSLTNFLWSRKSPVEESSLRKRAVKLEKELWEKEMEKKADIDEQLLEDRIRKKVFSELKKTTYHWKNTRYDEELGVVYMAARLAGGYAAVKRALNEIKKKDSSFAPQSLLDFGSGLGTVVWASHSHWGDSLKEMVCVDSSGPMNVLAERLLKGDEERVEPHIKQVYFRQFLPVSPKVQFDLVVAAFTLSELQNVKEREDTVLTLWRKTSSYLVLVENGTKEGHQMLMEARDTLLKKQDKIVHDIRPAAVFAPCPHERTCPKLASAITTPCNFNQMYQPLPLPGRNERQTEKFSYLILARTELEGTESEGVDWGRLISPVKRRTRHVHCRMCCPDGKLQHLVVTARKQSRDVYRCARSSDWGDRLPMLQGDDEDAESGSER
ncbi:ribosome assembly protein METTL17, mitochondrial [Pseudochaenichthys georgianus]|uniref:ribosome assembly protein METTL17, mitochondrial n=1 Tax=Pseudochaenichthys georgianus TaxID=52239 RepID=UPI00146DE21B|nr:methyltransferase-like protein 17, mitochondrial [Pseudochaenichthys georgianus]